MNWVLLTLLSALARGAPNPSMSLTGGDCIVHKDGTVEKVLKDTWTKLLLYPERPKDGSNAESDQAAQVSAVQEAKARMRRMHCAIRAVEATLEGPSGPKGGIVFDDPPDPNGNYDPESDAIILRWHDYFRDPENLSKALYHETLHRLEYRFKLRKEDEAASFHDSRRIKLILQDLFREAETSNPQDAREDAACLDGVNAEDGTLRDVRGDLYEPAYQATRACDGPPGTQSVPTPPGIDPTETQPMPPLPNVDPKTLFKGR